MNPRILLQIDSSLSGPAGKSSQLTAEFAKHWQHCHPSGRVVRRDLSAQPVPHLDADRFQAFRTPATDRTAVQRALAEYSDILIAEIRDADEVVLGLPMYNFGVPSTLKAWFDHIARVGITFRYTAQGPLGLLKDRPVHVLAARGGIYLGTGNDFQTPYIREFLSFLGIRDVRFIYAEGINISPDMASKALREAAAEVRSLFETSSAILETT